MSLEWWIAIGAVYGIMAMIMAGAFEALASKDDDLTDKERNRITWVGGILWLPIVLFGIGAALVKPKKDKGKEDNE